METTKPLRATKVEGYLAEPLHSGFSRTWEGHHATNPSVIRLSCDPRVFLGYRAGGRDDHHYSQYGDAAMGSHLGMAVMDARGEKVSCRLPLPIMKLVHGLDLPTTRAEYDRYARQYEHEIVLLHDFHLLEHHDHLHVIYHESEIHACYDCIVRMPNAEFLRRIERSIELSSRPTGEIIEEWQRLWWAPEVWRPSGTGKTHRIYASEASKNDIFFLRVADGTLRMFHRPAPDIAVLDTGFDTFTKSTPDGITAVGSLQTCVRPGYFDNSHIGNNGMPIRAKIGQADVFIDVTHGVHNELISDPNATKAMMTYLPYLRVLDYETGECLYYSEEPILELDETWREYVQDGTWVRKLDHLKGVMFAGGQLEVERGANGLDDWFSMYMGLGDTATGRAVFRLRDLLPDQVIADIQVRRAHQSVRTDGVTENLWRFPVALCGWSWAIGNNADRRVIHVRRTLEKAGHRERSVRLINTVPGRFDADGVFFDGRSVRYQRDLGWLVLYRGVRWDRVVGRKRTQSGMGVLLLDVENPERVLYRSPEPLADTVAAQDGWTTGMDPVDPGGLLDRIEDLIPEKVKAEIRRIYALQPIPSHMTMWLKHKSGAE